MKLKNLHIKKFIFKRGVGSIFLKNNDPKIGFYSKSPISLNKKIQKSRFAPCIKNLYSFRITPPII